MTKPERTPPAGRPNWLVAVLVLQTVALCIALVIPVTRSKTGSTWSPAELFWTTPAYLQKVLISFVMVNFLMGALGGIAWVWSRRSPPPE